MSITPGPLVAGPKPMEERSSRRMSLARRTIYAIVAPVAVAMIRLLWATYRVEVRGDDQARRRIEAGEPLILTLWHEGIFLAARYFRHLGALGARVTYLVSPSVDGELGTRVLRIMGSHVVRGSATRSGVKSMRHMYRAMVRDNASPVILPDGPQGPRHFCKPGSLLLAQMSGKPVLAMAVAAGWSWRLPTWDRLLLPLPFSRVRILVGEPYSVTSGLTEEQLEAERVRLEHLLGDLGRQAEVAPPPNAGS